MSPEQRHKLRSAQKIQGTACPVCGALAQSVNAIMATRSTGTAAPSMKEFIDQHAAFTYSSPAYTVRDIVAYHPDKFSTATLSKRWRQLTSGVVARRPVPARPVPARPRPRVESEADAVAVAAAAMLQLRQPRHAAVDLRTQLAKLAKPENR